MHAFRTATLLLVVILGGQIVVTAQEEKKDPLREPKITDDDRDHWSFRPLAKPKVPKIKNGDAARNPIDHFILARLNTEGLQPMPAAGRATLIRRLSFDLTGLPPTPKQVEAFSNDQAPDAYEKLVDRLLADVAHGERWAQHWLDLARFAETDGYEHDKVRKEAWRYRDWVIEALNHDLPYDEFLSLQVAGDEIKPDQSGSHIATGFLVSGPDMPDLNNASERQHVLLNEVTAAVGSVFMGLTMECAQCHNHKFDPISQADFYRLRAIFTNAFPKLKRDQQLAMTVREAASTAPDAHFMIRGDFTRPGPVLQPAFPRILNPVGHDIAKPSVGAKSSQRRLALAKWLTRADHLLTARVIVNRVWMHHFGRGLTNTPSDFGIMGDNPTHPELLDWLAAEFMRTGWSLKKLHRLIVTSATYRQASRPSDPEWSNEIKKDALERWQAAKKSDPKNKLLARMNRIRLDGEAIRDAMLAAANKLSLRRAGPGVLPPLPKELVATLLKDQWVVSPDEEDHRRRSIYIFVRRNLRYPIFEAFDRPDGNASCSRRTKSTTAPQALILLNSEFSAQMASVVAGHAAKTSAKTADQIRHCFDQILSRPPTPAEVKAAITFLDEQAARINKAGTQPISAESSHASALTDFCLALFNTNEFTYID